jgi:hypothetical protein
MPKRCGLKNVMIDNIISIIENIIMHYVTKFQTKPAHLGFVVDKVAIGKN